MQTTVHSSLTATAPDRGADPPARVVACSRLRLFLRAFNAGTGAQRPGISLTFARSRQLAEYAGPMTDLLLSTDIRLLQHLSLPGVTPVAFADDALVMAARRELRVTEATMLQQLQAPTLRIGLALPEFGQPFDPVNRLAVRLDVVCPGAGQRMLARSRSLAPSGDATSRRVMEGLGSGEVDVVVGLHSALRTLSAVADLIAPPADLAVAVTAGLAVLTPAGQPFAASLRGPLGQAMLTTHGLSRVAAHE